MPHVLTLSVPVDAPFRALAAEAAGRLVMLLGGTNAHADPFQAAVAAVVDEVAAEGPDATLVFDIAPGRVDVRVSCGTVSRLVTQSFPSA